MMATIGSLKDMCLDRLSDDWSPLWTRSPENANKLAWRDPDMVLIKDIAEKLLYKLSVKRKLNNKILYMFQVERTSLKHVHLVDMSKLTLKGLRMLETHRLVSLNIDIDLDFSLHEILSCLKSRNWTSLKMLRCANACRGSNPSLKSLHDSLFSLCFLSFENVKLSNSCLTIIACSLPNMRYLDISRNCDISDISPLKGQDQLETLIMYDMEELAEDSTVATLYELKNLKHLDVSLERNQTRSLMTALMSCPSSNPNLTLLDLTGRDAAPENMIRTYLDKHPSLRFLGLCFNTACRCSMFDVTSSEYRPGIDVAGSGSLDQIALSLRRYQLRGNIIWHLLENLNTALSRGCNCFLAADDKILMALVGVIRSDPGINYLMWMATRESMRCLKRLLEDGHVYHIEPDTITLLLRTCHDFLNRGARSAFHRQGHFPDYYRQVAALAADILNMVANI